jgi:hypothetical protein
VIQREIACDVTTTLERGVPPSLSRNGYQASKMVGPAGSDSVWQEPGGMEAGADKKQKSDQRNGNFDM